MTARETAIRQLEGTSAGNEALAEFNRAVDDIEAGTPVDAMEMKFKRGLSAAAAAELLEALKTYRCELDWQRDGAIDAIRKIAALYDIKNPDAPPSRP